MGIPQVILIILFAMSGTIMLVKHGEPRKEHNFIVWLVSACIELGLLYWGGFFQ